MNHALFFEGTGQGIRGKRTNVSLVYEACLEDDSQKRHLEAGLGARVGALLLGKTSGVGWRVIFARARRWYEARRFYAYVPLRGERVEEVLFPGVHSDVGGLYEDDHGLADAARAWVAAPAAEGSGPPHRATCRGGAGTSRAEGVRGRNKLRPSR